MPTPGPADLTSALLSGAYHKDKLMSQAEDPKASQDGPKDSWPERVLDALRRIFVPEPQPVPVPVVVRPGIPVRRRY